MYCYYTYSPSCIITLVVIAKVFSCVRSPPFINPQVNGTKLGIVELPSGFGLGLGVGVELGLVLELGLGLELGTGSLACLGKRSIVCCSKASDVLKVII